MIKFLVCIQDIRSVSFLVNVVKNIFYRKLFHFVVADEQLSGFIIFVLFCQRLAAMKTDLC